MVRGAAWQAATSPSPSGVASRRVSCPLVPRNRLPARPPWPRGAPACERMLETAPSACLAGWDIPTTTSRDPAMRLAERANVLSKRAGVERPGHPVGDRGRHLGTISASASPNLPGAIVCSFEVLGDHRGAARYAPPGS